MTDKAPEVVTGGRDDLPDNPAAPTDAPKVAPPTPSAPPPQL